MPRAPFYLPSFHLPACSNDNAHWDLHLSAGAGEVLRAQGEGGGSVSENTRNKPARLRGEPDQRHGFEELEGGEQFTCGDLGSSYRATTVLRMNVEVRESNQSHRAGSWAPGCVSSKAAISSGGEHFISRSLRSFVSCLHTQPSHALR